jgi:Bacterial PH domain/Short C-terminal domain
MSYADGLLSTGEQITYRNKQHLFIFFWIGGNLGSDGVSGGLKTLLGWATAILFFGGIVVAIWTALRYVNQEYVLTNRRVIQVEGVLNRNSTDSSLEKINDAVLNQSVFGRMFDFGDLTVLTASESGIDKMKMLRSPIVFKKAMLDAKHQAEVDMEREGWQPGPPIREGFGSPVAAAGAASVPAGGGQTATPPPRAAAATPATPPATPRADPDEVTRTLASLADLRDRGAITAEEYEQKKADLLSRL